MQLPGNESWMNLQSSIFDQLGIWPGDAPVEHVSDGFSTWASPRDTRLPADVNKEALRLFILFLETVVGVFEKLDDRSREVVVEEGGDAITTWRRFS